MIAFDLRLYDAVASTQDEAARLLAKGAREGTVIAARQQTAGRGRQGRLWTSPPGNVHLTVILRPKCPPARIPELSFVASLSVADAATPFLPTPPTLKWPNDVLSDGAKIAGILIEQRPGAVLLGLGINVHHRPTDTPYPVTCLGPSADPDQVRASVLKALREWLHLWNLHGFGPVRAAWLARAHPVGAPLRVSGPHPAIGRFAGLAPDGALLLEAADGQRRIIAGDVAIM